MNTNLSALESALKSGAVSITYTKLDGSTRVARATRNVDLIVANGNADSELVLAQVAKANGTNRYFDLDKNGWRTFNSADVKVNI